MVLFGDGVAEQRKPAPSVEFLFGGCTVPSVRFEVFGDFQPPFVGAYVTAWRVPEGSVERINKIPY